MNQAAVAADEYPDILGHPRGLVTLFLTEMWERFSYYGMRALLVLFMVEQVQKGGLGWSDQTAYAIYGLYTAAAYLVCVPGGWIADRLWGAQKAVWVGGIIIMCGHFVLALQSIAAFFLGLFLVCLGTGLLKPNISAVVGALYASGDGRRDAGFTLFYIGINLGAAIGGVVCGWLAGFNWHYGFAAAGVGMLAGLIQFRLTRGSFGSAGLAPATTAAPAARRAAWSIVALVIGAALFLLVGALRGWFVLDAVRFRDGATWVLVGVTIAFFAYMFVAGRLTREETKRVVVILVLVLACAMFWAGFEQAGSSLNLFAERFTVRVVAGFEVPAEWYQSLNPAFIILLAPVYSSFWVWLARRNLEPAAPMKFAFGLIMLGLGFAVMIGAAELVASGRQAFPTWLVLTYLLHTMGELALSPVGLSAMTKLAPQRFVGQMMGIWFMANSLGYVIASSIAGTFDTDNLGAWPGLYTQIVLTTVGTGLVLLVFSRPLRKLMGGVR